MSCSLVNGIGIMILTILVFNPAGNCQAVSLSHAPIQVRSRVVSNAPAVIGGAARGQQTNSGNLNGRFPVRSIRSHITPAFIPSAVRHK